MRFAFNPWRTFILFALISAQGVLHSIALASVIIAISNIATGEETVTAAFASWSISIPSRDALYLALAGIVFFSVIGAMSGRALLKDNIEWQRELMLKALNSMPHIADMRFTRQPIPGRKNAMIGYILRAVKSAYLVERFISIGGQQFVLLICCSAVVFALDWLTIPVLALLSLPFVPAYSFVFRKIIAIRTDTRRQLPALKPKLRELLVKYEGQQVPIPSREFRLRHQRHRFDAGYSMASNQVRTLLTVQTLTLVHLVTCISVMVWLRLDSVLVLGELTLIYALALFLMLRSALAIISLAGRLSRAHTELSLLANIFVPPNSDPPYDNMNPDSRSISISTLSGKHKIIKIGQPVAVVGMSAKSQLDFIPLSNSISLPQNTEIKNNYALKLINRAALKAIKAQAAETKTSHLCAYVVDENIWSSIEKSRELEELRDNSFWFVIVEPSKNGFKGFNDTFLVGEHQVMESLDLRLTIDQEYLIKFATLKENHEAMPDDGFDDDDPERG